MNEYARYLDDVQFRDMVARVLLYLDDHSFLKPQAAKCRLTLEGMVEVTLLHFCQDPPQMLMAALYDVSQSTVSRAISRLRPVMNAALAPFRPGVIDLLCDLSEAAEKAAQASDLPPIVLVDGTLVRESWRKGNREFYSGKHRATGRSVQVVSDEAGNLLYVSQPLPGRTHDRKAVYDTEIEAAIAASGVLGCGDKAYLGTGFLVPAKPSKHHPLTPAQVVENRWINRGRFPIERAISHIKGGLRILRNGIRTRGSDRVATVIETINLAVSLYFYRRDWRPNDVRA